MDLSPNPSPLSPTEPYGKTAPPVPGAKLLSAVMSAPASLKTGVVTDCWPHVRSCLVLPLNEGSGTGIPCLWADGSNGRFGGVVGTSPPQVGSSVLVLTFPGSGYGYVVGSVPSLWGDDPDPEERMLVDPMGLVISSDRDTLSEPDSFGATAMSMAGACRLTGGDVFAGEWAEICETGTAAFVGFGRAMLRASELAKFEAFVQDDLARIVGHRLDMWTCRTDRCARPSVHGPVDYESSFESLETDKPDRIWLGGLLGGGESLTHLASHGRPQHDGEGGGQDAPKVAVSRRRSDSAGNLLDRSVSSAGFAKVPFIAEIVPVPGKMPCDPGYDPAEEDPDEEGKEDFRWGEGGEMQMQARDYVAWICGRNETAAAKSLGGSVWIGEGGAPRSGARSPGRGGYLMEDIDVVEVSDAFGRNRRFGAGSAHVLALPDGSVSICDAWGSSISMSHGNITLSPANDLLLRPARSIVGLAGHDVNLTARREVDIVASEGQLRAFGGTGAMVHGERGGVMLSTHSSDVASEPGDPAGFVPSGVVVRASEGTFTVRCENFDAQVGTKASFTGTEGAGGDAKPMGAFLVDSEMVAMNYRDGVLIANPATRKGVHISDDWIETDAGIVSNEGSVFARNGMVAAGSLLSDGGEVSVLLPEPPDPDGDVDAEDEGLSKFWRRVRRISEYVQGAFGRYTKAAAARLEFSFRQDSGYGPEPVVFQQQWERSGSDPEWGAAPRSEGPWSKRPSFPWPGRRGWIGARCYRSYGEVNVDELGFPAEGASMSPDPGEVSRRSLRSAKVAP